MCGIAFIYAPILQQQVIEKKLSKALDQLLHRGPDEEGIFSRENYAIGHRRLSIIDLSKSHQPMADPSGRYILSYNGEIYNYRELRVLLQSNWSFRTSGDTEVLLAGLILQGPDFLTLAEGMWSFVLWDTFEKKVLAARDRMGKKPLFYCSGNDCFSVASELPALKYLVPSRLTEDLNSTADFFRYGYYLPGTTAYEQIKEVLPGHIMTWSPDVGVESRPYWRLSLQRYQGSKSDAIEEVRFRLESATKSRLVADVEVGAFLSGGIDSSLIVALMASRFGITPKTFTIGFNEASFDERGFAREVSRLYKTDHYEKCYGDWDRGRLESIILNHIGQPFYDASVLPTDMVSGLASDYVKVVLSGDGGDELFSGYQRYQARRILRWYSKLPRFFRKNIESAVRLLPEPMHHHSRSILKKAHLFLDVLERQKSETPYIAPVLYSDAKFSKLVGDLAGFGYREEYVPDLDPVDDVRQMMVADSAVYMPQDILVKVDRASMAQSLEVRTPFLDSRVVEMAFSLPVSWHRGPVSGKQMLRKAFYELLPNNIWNRRKQGFGVPIHQWFRSGLGSELEELMTSNSSSLDSGEVNEMLHEHRRGIRDHGFRLWNIYVYLLWRSTSDDMGLPYSESASWRTKIVV